jgi:hypothetical protein
METGSRPGHAALRPGPARLSIPPSRREHPACTRPGLPQQEPGGIPPPESVLAPRTLKENPP